MESLSFQISKDVVTEEKRVNPLLALCNIFGQDAEMLANFAYKNGFQGIDWSLDLNIPQEDFLRKMVQLKDFEVRFHCRFQFFHKIDLAHADQRSEQAMNIFMQIIRLVSAAGGKHITLHMGLDQNSDKELDWQKGIENLSRLVSFGSEHGIVISLENLATGWTSDPKLFETLIKETGAGVTFDIGHAHAYRKNQPGKDLYKQYILPHRERVFNAHIYHTEILQFGHVAPKSLEQIVDRLELLQLATSCGWWVIELTNPEEILNTRDFLSNYPVSLKNFEQNLLTT